MPGTFLDENTDMLIRDYNIGGIILFSRNIQDPVQLAILCNQIQDKSIEYHGLPMFLAVDQEGGRVARLKRPFTEFSGNEAIGIAADPLKSAFEFGTVTAKEMKLVGLNMNMAPVIDVGRDNIETHLRGRIFGENPEVVGALGCTVINALQNSGILAVAKHFPGLGRTSIDPHLNLPSIDIDEGEIKKINLPPFNDAIKEHVAGIMTSHAIYPALDPERPATLSPRILIGLLREKMGFKGLIITDDLEMGAIEKKYSVAEGALLAFKAGADILLVCENQDNVYRAISLIRKKALQENQLNPRLEESFKRINQIMNRNQVHRQEISILEVKKYFNLQ